MFIVNYEIDDDGNQFINDIPVVNGIVELEDCVVLVDKNSVRIIPKMKELSDDDLWGGEQDTVKVAIGVDPNNDNWEIMEERDHRNNHHTTYMHCKLCDNYWWILGDSECVCPK